MSSFAPPLHEILLAWGALFALLALVALALTFGLAALLRRLVGDQARAALMGLAFLLLVAGVALVVVEPEATRLLDGQNEEVSFALLAAAAAQGIFLVLHPAPDLRRRRRR